MNHRLILAVALVAAALAGCSTAHKKDDVAPITPTQAGNAGQAASTASTNAAGNSSGLSASDLAAQQAAAERALLQQMVAHFDYDQYTLRADDEVFLKAHAKYLAKHAKARVRLAGHTDERGTTEYNMALGERRAKAVSEFLTSLGVKPVQLDVVSFGKEKPLDPGHTEEAWAKNRRVELNYLNDAP